MLPGGADVGEAMITDPLISVISFTGSTAAGRKVGALAGQHLKRVHLELGGNSALIVLDDADVAKAASAGAWGSFLHQGQICMTTGRHIVADAIYDDYVGAPGGEGRASAGRRPGVRPGRARADHRRAAARQGARAGHRLGRGRAPGWRPAVRTRGCSTSRPCSPTWPRRCPRTPSEVFGPVAPVVRFSDADEVAKLAADSEYGLSLGILTRDVMRGLELARKIPTGIVHINDQTVDDSPNTPFGGIRASGTGARFGGSANIDAFTDTRWVTVRGDIAPYPF